MTYHHAAAESSILTCLCAANSTKAPKLTTTLSHDAASDSESDDGLVHHAQSEEFALRSTICLPDDDVEQDGTLKCFDVVVTRKVRCRTDRTVQKYVVVLPSGEIKRVRAHECYATWNAAIAASEKQRAANGGGNHAIDVTPPSPRHLRRQKRQAGEGVCGLFVCD